MDIFDEVQMDKTAWAERKQARRKEVYAQIDDFLDNMPLKEQSVRQYLTIQAHFPLCSVGNAALIASQKPEATEYHTFDEWKKQEVSVRKGEQGFSMLVPNGTYTGNDGKTHTSYEVQKVFDISQTDAEPKPAPQDIRMNLKAMLMRPGCPVQVVEQQKGAVFVAGENRVEIGRGMTMEETMRTLSVALAHGELARTIPNYRPGDPQNSFYARCASFVVCTRFGVEPEGYRFQDMQNALGPCNSQELRGHLEVIRSTAGAMIDRTEKARSAMLSRAKTEKEQEAR